MVFRVFFLIVFFFLNNVDVEKYGSFKSFGYIYIYIYRYGRAVNWDNVVFNTPKMKKASD